MANSMHVKKGDTVKVLSGKDKGKQGKVLRSVPAKQRVVVEKVNMIKKAMRPTQQNPQGGITTMEAPIHVSNVMLVCACARSATGTSTNPSRRPPMALAPDASRDAGSEIPRLIHRKGNEPPWQRLLV